MSNARRFRIKGLLGKGGFGVVYRATLISEGGFQTEVAVKLLKSEEISRPMLTRFKDEARVLGLIRDRAVVGVFPPALLDGAPALIMEYVDGQSTSGLMKSNRGPLPPRVCTEIIGEVARALHDVYHQEGPDGAPLHLVHRDIKPANIQVTLNGSVKLLDFGIAKAAFEGREAETTMHLFGTPQYMAPERLAGETGPASDIWSLGCTWRRLMIGDQPIGGGRFKPSPIPPATSPELEEALAFIVRMLAVEPEDRPDAAAVHEFCEGLAQRIQGASLRKWAGAHVRSEVAELDELSGTVVMESIALESAFASLAGVMETTGATLAAPTTTLTTVTTGSAASTMETVVLPIEAPVAPPSSGSRSLLAVGVAALVLGGIAMGIGCYGLWLADPFGTPAVVPAPVPIEPAEPVPLPDPSEPVPVEPVAPEPAPEPVVVDPVPQPTVVRPVQPVPAPVEPVEPASPVPEPVVVPAPVEPPAPTCSVRVKADDVLVIVRDAQGAKVRPGPVPCGTYTIAVAFDPSTPSALESQDPVGLSDGQVLDLTCSAGLRRCITKIR